MKDFKKVYFLGIGGIGMSALARYFLHQGCSVAGYDRTSTKLTELLVTEGAQITYEDSVSTIPVSFTSPSDTLVVYTPALPADHKQLNYFRNSGFELLKRSKMLGVVAQNKYVMAIAGTHGKTTTTTMTAWFNHIAGGGGSAFLGGISKNFDNNLVLGEGCRLAVEADEFDRSFLQLYPDVAVITSADADHLDIYGTYEAVKEAFSQFISQIKPNGTLILKLGVELEINSFQLNVYRYSYDTPTDFYAQNIELLDGGYYSFDIVCPDRTIAGCRLGIPGWVNIENCVAAVSLMWIAAGAQNQPLSDDLLRQAISSFSGVKRRFDFYINTPQMVYMDDYAHHPEELRATITSVKKMFPGRKLTAVFQPHLYSRTRDLYMDFGQVLSLADEVLLLPIYPAREEPIEGVNSQMLLQYITAPAQVVEKKDLLERLKVKNPQTIVTFGAGDIDYFCEPIAKLFRK